MAANKATAAKTRTKKKERKNISAGAAHIQISTPSIGIAL